MKINRKKLKIFLESSNNVIIKKFVIDLLKKIYTPSPHLKYAYYIFDLDILETDSNNKLQLADYDIIDFDYLNSLPDEIIQEYLYYFKNKNIDSNIVSLLKDSGVLISNIEYLKRKREQKLKKNKNEEFDEHFYDSLCVDR